MRFTNIIVYRLSSLDTSWSCEEDKRNLRQFRGSKNMNIAALYIHIFFLVGLVKKM